MKKIEWYCTACNPSAEASGVRFESIVDASRYPYCRCGRTMQPVESRFVPAYWYRRGRWHGRGQAVTDKLNAGLDIDGGDTSIVAVEWPADLPPVRDINRIAWERGRLDGYRDCQHRVLAHPELMEDLD